MKLVASATIKPITSGFPIKTNTKVYKTKNHKFIAVCNTLDLYTIGNSIDNAVKRMGYVVDFYLSNLNQKNKVYTNKKYINNPIHNSQPNKNIILN